MVARRDTLGVLLDSFIQALVPSIIVREQLRATGHQIHTVLREVSGSDLIILFV